MSSKSSKSQKFKNLKSAFKNLFRTESKSEKSIKTSCDVRTKTESYDTRKSHVSFCPLVRVCVIPSRSDYDAELMSELFWSSEDYNSFKTEAINEMKNKWVKNNILVYAVKRSADHLSSSDSSPGLSQIALRHVDSVSGFPFANKVVYSPQANAMAVPAMFRNKLIYKVITHVDSVQKLLIDKTEYEGTSSGNLPYDLLKLSKGHREGGVKNKSSHQPFVEESPEEEKKEDQSELDVDDDITNGQDGGNEELQAMGLLVDAELGEEQQDFF
jgi:hypothetical protein